MPRLGPKIISGRFSKGQRKRRRSGINLEEAALSDQTRSRYYIALNKLTPALTGVRSLPHMDELCCDWIHKMWESGEPLLTIGDALSALHYFQPFTRRGIPHAWKLFSAWRKIEVPSRAPPLTEALVRSMSAYELHHNRLEMATCLMLAFYALLRAGAPFAYYRRCTAGKAGSGSFSAVYQNKQAVRSSRCYFSARSLCIGTPEHSFGSP